MKQRLAIRAFTLSIAIVMGLGCGGEATVIGTHEPDVHGGKWDVGTPDVGAPDIRADDATSGDAVDATQEPDLGVLSDYQRCFSDGDCASGMGSCLKEVALNRVATNGAQSVAINEIFESLEQDEGICTVVCTNDPNACDALSVSGEAPDAAPHVCQLVTEGARPYPASAPAFPFDAALNPAEQAAGQIFGAICRPAFELDPVVDAAICATCQGGADSCGADAICWSLLQQERAMTGEAGTCLRRCDADNSCALGFACDIQDSNAQGYCRPVLDTCTACRDLDGDGFGTGRCGDEVRPVTPDDCDDRNPTAYFDPDNMAHAFPASCGTHDLNCNGLSDDFEQIGDTNYPGEHCASCYDVCDGEVTNGQLACRNLGDLDNPAPACTAQCERDADGKMLFADCDGDISNGCEVPIDDISRQYYRDLDGDGYGDPNDVIFTCDPNVLPAGYANNSLDCNDNSSAAHGGTDAPAEICDGIDNNCNGLIDDADPSAVGLQAFYRDNDADGFGSSSASNTIYACQAPLGFASVGGDCNDTQPHINPGASDNACNHEDTNCDGIVDNAFPEKGNACVVGQGICRNTGAMICDATQNNTTCSVQPHPAQNESCDGLDNNCNAKSDEGCPVTGGTISSTGSVINRGGAGTNDKADDVDRRIVCPSGTVLVGIDVRERINNYAGLAYAIDLQCRDLKIGRTTTYQYSSEAGSGSLREVIGVGLRNESSTEWKFYRCPELANGAAVYKMYYSIDGDGHVRGVTGHCRPYEMPTTPGSSRVNATIQPKSDVGKFISGDPSKGTNHGPFECAADEAAVGMLMSGRATTRSGEDGMTKLQLLCKKLNFDTIP